MNTILFCILVAIGFAAFVFLGWSFCNWIDGYKDAGIRMSFGEFRRIYELAPSKWEGRGDYSYCRGEWVSGDKEDLGKTYIFTSIAMKTLFDFWRLLHWQKEIARKEKREERFKTEKISLKKLTIMLEKDAENIRRKLEKEEQEVEKLRQEAIDRLGGNK